MSLNKEQINNDISRDNGISDTFYHNTPDVYHFSMRDKPFCGYYLKLFYNTILFFRRRNKT
jgi:hypothetical protein